MFRRFQPLMATTARVRSGPPACQTHRASIMPIVPPVIKIVLPEMFTRNLNVLRPDAVIDAADLLRMRFGVHYLERGGCGKDRRHSTTVPRSRLKRAMP